MWPRDPVERVLVGALGALILIAVVALGMVIKDARDKRIAEAAEVEAVEYMVRCPACGGTGFVNEKTLIKEKEDVEREMGERR